VALLSKADKGSIKSRYFMPWQCHNAYAITGTICLATAAKSKGTICNEYYDDFSDEGFFEIEHPTGISKVKVKVTREGEEIIDLVATTTRHARLIMSGEVHIQKSLLK
jgi:4-oxalomesaconate tautomerase